MSEMGRRGAGAISTGKGNPMSIVGAERGDARADEDGEGAVERVERG